ncbi:MAG: hypothetical protein SVR04_12170 [Spirochaetota bacterium]|nr:hypothetical protein [Spirochaetota bacterium]
MKQSKNSVAFILSAEPKYYPFSRAPLSRIEGRTFLENTASRIQELKGDLEPADIFCIGTDEEVLLLADRIGLKIIETSFDYSDLSRYIDNPEFREYTHIVYVSMFFPYFDYQQIVDILAKQVYFSTVNIVAVNSNGSFYSSDLHNRIATIVNSFVTVESDQLTGAFIPIIEPYWIHSVRDIYTVQHLRNRKKIVFNVEAYNEIGMGHIYRCLSVAGHLPDYEVRFISSQRSQIIKEMVESYGYQCSFVKEKVTADHILKHNPDVVINDVLNTDAQFIEALAAEIKVINFEDLGEGSSFTHATINDLYTEGEDGGNIYWGPQYYFLRDEFESAVPRSWNENIESVLITFGGTDPNNLTLGTLQTILPVCAREHIRIYVVTGIGYEKLEMLEEEISGHPEADVEHIHKTGVMSSIMEHSDVAICSNGRTSFELAHMNIPSIVICHHEREALHSFAKDKNGFINLGVYGGTETLEQLKDEFNELVVNSHRRKQLFSAMKNIDLRNNKERVIGIIKNIAEEK